jgi:predicted aconitase with swiveling domain
MNRSSFRGRLLVGGAANGTALVSKRAFTFAHGVDPESGDVTDIRSDIEGENVRGRVLFYPYGKGSTTASAWFLETVRCGNAPAAIVTTGPDLSAVIGSVLARVVYGKTIPVLSSFPEGLYSKLDNQKEVAIEGEELTISN